MEGKVKRVIFVKIDRLSRDNDDYFAFYRLCLSFKVELISLNEPILDTAMGELLQRVLISMAEFERKQISERTKAGYIGMFQKGMYAFGGTMPLGISKDKNKKLYFNKDINKVKFIFKKLNEGHCYSSVQQMYNKKYKEKVNRNFVEELAKKNIYKGYVDYEGVKYYLIDPIVKDFPKIKREN